MKSNLKTSAALRVGDTDFLRNEPMEKFIAQIASPIMDEQDEIESLKAQIRARSAAQLKLKRAAMSLLGKWFSCPFCGEARITSEYDSYGTTLYCADGCHGRFNFPAFEAEVMGMWKRNRRKLRQQNEKLTASARE
jgi:hypothetical protein